MQHICNIQRVYLYFSTKPTEIHLSIHTTQAENKTLKILIFLPLFIIPLIVGIILFAMIESYNYTIFSSLDTLKEHLYTQEEKKLQLKVINISNSIEYQISILKTEVQQHVKERVYLAHKIATSIYEEYKDTAREQEIQRQIKSALKPLLWNNEESYIWIVDYEGVLHHAPKYLEKHFGKSILDFEDVTGRKVIQEEIALAKNNGEGFLWDFFFKPNTKEKQQYEQLAFVKAFGHYNWYFGSSEYFDTAQKKSNEALLKEIRQINTTHKNNMYVFDKKGTIIVDEMQLEGHTLTNEKTKELRDYFLKELKDLDHVYVSHEHPNPLTGKLEKRMDFLRSVPGTDWVIGSGFDFFEIEKLVQKTHTEVKSKLERKIQELIYLAVFIVLISLFISYYIVKKVHSYFIDYRKKVDQSNIAQRNNMEQINILLQESNEMHRELQKANDLFSEHVISSHADSMGAITFVSQALCKISGFSKEELLGQAHSILRHPDMPSSTFKELWDTIQSGETWTGEIKNKTKTGGYYWTEAIIIPDQDSTGKIIGYQSIRQDITPHKAKEDFMAIMSHELRTPLNSILGFSSILGKNKKLGAKELSYAQKIHSSGKHLLEMIASILDLSKIKNGNFALDPIALNLNTMLQDLSSTVEGLTTKKKITFKRNISENIEGEFFADATRIKQILFNLLSNAIKFTPDEGEVSLDMDYADGILSIIVTDNGIGISKDAQDKIFEPFKQADQSTTRQYGGTGLGLSITQNLVHLMHGSINLESKEGEGSTFSVKIQIEKAQTKDTLESISQVIESKENTLQGHILIAEDNQTNKMLLKMLVEDFGLTCDTVDDGLQALKVYDPAKHKILLTDENMPIMSGIESMKKIREKYKEKCGPIIVITANALKGDKEKFLEAGMDHYVSKPIDEDELYKAIRKFL